LGKTERPFEKRVFYNLSLINYKIIRAEFSLFNVKKGHPTSWLLPTFYAADDCYEVCNIFYNVSVLLLAMDCMPRISRAQVFDVLSSMSNVAGYRAVIEAANHYPRFLAGLKFIFVN